MDMSAQIDAFMRTQATDTTTSKPPLITCNLPTTYFKVKVLWAHEQDPQDAKQMGKWWGKWWDATVIGYNSHDKKYHVLYASDSSAEWIDFNDTGSERVEWKISDDQLTPLVYKNLTEHTKALSVLILSQKKLRAKYEEEKVFEVVRSDQLLSELNDLLLSLNEVVPSEVFDHVKCFRYTTPKSQEKCREDYVDSVKGHDLNFDYVALLKFLSIINVTTEEFVSVSKTGSDAENNHLLRNLVDKLQAPVLRLHKILAEKSPEVAASLRFLLTSVPNKDTNAVMVGNWANINKSTRGAGATGNTDTPVEYAFEKQPQNRAEQGQQDNKEGLASSRCFMYLQLVARGLQQLHCKLVDGLKGKTLQDKMDAILKAMSEENDYDQTPLLLMLSRMIKRDDQYNQPDFKPDSTLLATDLHYAWEELNEGRDVRGVHTDKTNALLDFLRKPLLTALAHLQTAADGGSILTTMGNTPGLVQLLPAAKIEFETIDKPEHKNIYHIENFHRDDQQGKVECLRASESMNRFLDLLANLVQFSSISSMFPLDTWLMEARAMLRICRTTTNSLQMTIYQSVAQLDNQFGSGKNSVAQLEHGSDDAAKQRYKETKYGGGKNTKAQLDGCRRGGVTGGNGCDDAERASAHNTAMLNLVDFIYSSLGTGDLVLCEEIKRICEDNPGSAALVAAHKVAKINLLSKTSSAVALSRVRRFELGRSLTIPMLINHYNLGRLKLDDSRVPSGTKLYAKHSDIEVDVIPSTRTRACSDGKRHQHETGSQTKHKSTRSSSTTSGLKHWPGKCPV